MLKKVLINISVIGFCLIALSACNSTNINDPKEPAISKKWSTYTNKEYGFTIDYPKELNGESVVITQDKNVFKLQGKNPVGNEAEIPITIGTNIRYKKDIEKFIKNTYFEGCEVKDVLYTELNNGLVPVDIAGTDGNGECWINWITFVKFSPGYNKIVSIDLGQEPPFNEKVNGEIQSYNMEIVNSFKFTSSGTLHSDVVEYISKENKEAIDAYVKNVENTLETYSKCENTVFDLSTEGAQLLTYYDDNNLVKLDVVYYGETGKVEKEMYLKDNQVVHNNVINEHYNQPIYEQGDLQTEKVILDQQYFKNGKLAFWTKGGEIIDPSSEDFLEEANQLQKEFDNLHLSQLIEKNICEQIKE